MRMQPVYALTLLLLAVLTGTGQAFGQSDFVRGDVNVDGAVDQTDAIVLLEALFLGSPVELPCDDAADTEDSGSLDISDGIYLLLFLFAGGQPLPPPAPPDAGEYSTALCRPDPTPDDLSCESHPACPDLSGDVSYVARLYSAVTLEFPPEILAELSPGDRELLEQRGDQILVEEGMIVTPEVPIRGRWIGTGPVKSMVDVDGIVRLADLRAGLTELRDVPIYWGLEDERPTVIVPVLHLAEVGGAPEPTLVTLPYEVPDNMDGSEHEPPQGNGGGADTVCLLRDCSPLEEPLNCCADYNGIGSSDELLARDRNDSLLVCAQLAIAAFIGSTCYDWVVEGPCYNEGAVSPIFDGPPCRFNHKYRYCQTLKLSGLVIEPKPGSDDAFVVGNATPSSSVLLRLDPPIGSLSMSDLANDVGALFETTVDGQYELRHYDDELQQYDELIELEYAPPEDAQGECGVTIIAKAWGLTRTLAIAFDPGDFDGGAGGLAAECFQSDGCVLVSSDLPERTINGDVTIFSQDELAAITEDDTVITEITGNLTIGGDPGMASQLSDLSAFNYLETIGGDLVVRNNAQLADLGLRENLTSVGGDVRVSQNAQLVDIDGLCGLHTINGALEVSRNPSLLDLDGLAQVTSASEVSVANNDVLSDVSGLAKLTVVSGNGLTFWNNPSLTEVHLSSLASIGVFSPDSDDVNGELSFSYNEALTTIDCPALLEVARALLIVKSEGPPVSANFPLLVAARAVDLSGPMGTVELPALQTSPGYMAMAIEGSAVINVPLAATREVTIQGWNSDVDWSLSLTLKAAENVRIDGLHRATIDVTVGEVEDVIQVTSNSDSVIQVAAGTAAVVQIAGNADSTIGPVSTTTVTNDVSVNGNTNTSLTSFSFGTIEGDAGIRNNTNTSLKSFDFGTMMRDLRITSNRPLSLQGLDANVGRNLIITGNTGISDDSARAIANSLTINGGVTIFGNTE